MSEFYVGQCMTREAGTGNAQLWNPWGSGVTLKVSKICVAGARWSGSDALGADLRRTRSPLPTIEFDGHVSNKVFGGLTPKSEFRRSLGTPPADYPLNRPIHEIWLGVDFQDRQYSFDPPIEVPQGWGLCVSMTTNAKAITSWQWEEVEREPIFNDPWSGVEGIVSNMTNAALAFDGSEETYADDTPAGSVSFHIGKTWAEERTVSSIVLKSQTTRSFSGRNPPRSISWEVQTQAADGSWQTAQQGVFVEAPGGWYDQSVLTINGPFTGVGHRVCMSDSPAAPHRIAVLNFTF